MARLYTRSGDKGQSGLADGQRRAKSDLRFELLGTIDEANAAMGAALAFLPPDFSAREVVRDVQSQMFTLGAAVAGSGAGPDEATITRMERAIDAADEKTPPLKNFILPSGSKGAALLHQARAVVRRAERVRQRLTEKENCPDFPGGIFLNRLSDLLFALARLAVVEAGGEEVLWRG